MDYLTDCTLISFQIVHASYRQMASKSPTVHLGVCLGVSDFLLFLENAQPSTLALNFQSKIT